MKVLYAMLDVMLWNEHLLLMPFIVGMLGYRLIYSYFRVMQVMGLAVLGFLFYAGLTAAYAWAGILFLKDSAILLPTLLAVVQLLVGFGMAYLSYWRYIHLERQMRIQCLPPVRPYRSY